MNTTSEVDTDSTKKKKHARIWDNLTKNLDDVKCVADFAKNLFGINVEGDVLNQLGNIIIREKGLNLNISPTPSAA